MVSIYTNKLAYSNLLFIIKSRLLIYYKMISNFVLYACIFLTIISLNVILGVSLSAPLQIGFFVISNRIKLKRMEIRKC